MRLLPLAIALAVVLAGAPAQAQQAPPPIRVDDTLAPLAAPLPDAARLFLRASCGEKLRETLRVPTPDGLPVKLQLALMPI